MFPKMTRIWALLCLFLALQLTAARSFQNVRMRDDASVTHVPILTSVPGMAPIPTSRPDATESDGSKQTATTRPPATTTFSTSVIPTSTIVYQTTIFNSTYSTVPEGELPLKPRITPGWGVAGVIMIITGLAYTLIGIKNQYINSFFSIAYVTSLGVTVLIVYVMSVPVSDAIQGGYIVAIMLAGCAFGAASMFFKELTEGLGCALGGFCVGMWLLCLVPGGLLTAAATKAIFIASFTLIGFGFYFSRWTRDWAMIVLIAFGGATVIVLGLDCYSRSGLKEFWAYVWNLNDQLFPLGANTYPVTKGIRVEAALIIIICLVGVVSQIKLWHIVREQREKKAAERAEGQRDLEAEEANVGRHIQEQTERERAQWERVYGDGTVASATLSRCSDVGDIDMEKRMQGAKDSSTDVPSKADGIEMADMSEKDHPHAVIDGLMSAEAVVEGKLTVRVAVDEVIEEEEDDQVHDEKALECGAGGQRLSPNSTSSKRARRNDGQQDPQQQAPPPPPEIVPLPFKIPLEGDEFRGPGDRSSFATFATFADDDGDGFTSSRKRNSLVKRLSRNSTELFRSISQRPRRSSTHGRLNENTTSLEELVEGSYHAIEDDRSSLGATVDVESLSGGEAHSVMSLDKPKRRSIQIMAELGKVEKKLSSRRKSLLALESKPTEDEPATEKDGANENQKKDKENGADKEGPRQIEEGTMSQPAIQEGETRQAIETAAEAVQVSTNTEEVKAAPPPDAKQGAAASGSVAASDVDVQVSQKSKTEEAAPAAIAAVDKTTEKACGDIIPSSVKADKARRERGPNSGSISLTKDHLPKSLSKVALSYRTNEWAKHLSQADAPEPDDIQIEPVVLSARAGKEVARAVDVEDLQKTGADGSIQRTTHKRNDSQPSSTSRSNPVRPGILKKETVAASPDITPNRLAMSPELSPNTGRPGAMPRRTGTGFDPIAEEHESHALIITSPAAEAVNETGSGPGSPSTIQSSDVLPRPGVVSYSSPQTLLGQRELFLRNKAQGTLVCQSPEPSQGDGLAAASELGSLYNYPMYAAALASDPDDLPLSQRKEMIRQTGVMTPPPPPFAGHHRSNSGVVGSDVPEKVVRFDSHQPKRIASLPTTAAREAQLANFRQAVAQDLRPAMPGLVPSAAGAVMYSSSTAHLGGIDAQRNHMLNQMEAEAHRREMQRREKERQNAVFDSRMRNGDLIEAHREVLRRMQNAAKEA